MYDRGPFRTNNHVEAWHNRLNMIVGVAHANIYELVKTFKQEQASVDVTSHCFHLDLLLDDTNLRQKIKSNIPLMHNLEKYSTTFNSLHAEMVCRVG